MLEHGIAVVSEDCWKTRGLLEKFPNFFGLESAALANVPIS